MAKKGLEVAVIKSKRGESAAQFIETAYNLQVHVTKMCIKFPKRYTFFTTIDIVEGLWGNIYDLVTDTDKITLYSKEPISEKLDIILKAVR